MVNLARYLERIRHPEEPALTAGSLASLHLAHATSIPFENLDVLLKRPIKLDVQSVWKKLVEDRRGGYCFEQNALFATVLETIGFPVKRLAARVRMGTLAQRPRTHMTLLVEAGGGPWLADVGFGGGGLLRPLPLLPNAVAEQYGWKYRIVEEGPVYVLQSLRADGWFDLYSFNLEEQLPIDYEVANYYTATHPESHFTFTLTAQLPGTSERFRLTNRRFTIETPTGITESNVETDDELIELLGNRFGLEFPRGTRFPFAELAPTAASSG